MAKKKKAQKEEQAQVNEQEQVQDQEQENSADTKQVSWEEKAAELNDKYLRLYSEFDNYRKRTIKEKADIIKSASKDIIQDLLPVVDDFDRTMQALNDSKDIDAFAEGVKLVQHKFKSILEKQGLQHVEAKGETFDPELHEAVTKIPAPSDELKGKVVDVIEKGYHLNEKVLRYAKVVVGE